jgi:cyclopropane-fatty-acyl-phospholipid synthase
VFDGRRHDPGQLLEASVVVHDRRAYTAVFTEGSIGLGRGFVEGWWSSDDPVSVVRVLIRNMSAIDALRNRIQRITGPVADKVRRRAWHDMRRRNREDIAAHYDLGNDFFALFLDETMTYSCAVFPAPSTTLEEASQHKYDLLIDKLGLTPDHHLLEIGTGWGGLAIRAAQRSGCRVTTTTISAEQLHEARRRVIAASVGDRVTVIDQDWRDLAGVHDRVISIEMIEAVDWRDYDRYFATIERCLAPDGLAAIQAICVPDQRWERSKNTRDFIKHFVFPNGCLASVAAIEQAVTRATSMGVVDVEDFGPHYAETLLRWRQRFLARIDDAKAFGLDDRFCRLWEFYLAYCEAGFRERHCTVVQVLLAGARSPLHPRTGLAS